MACSSSLHTGLLDTETHTGVGADDIDASSTDLDGTGISIGNPSSPEASDYDPGISVGNSTNGNETTDGVDTDSPEAVPYDSTNPDNTQEMDMGDNDKLPGVESLIEFCEFFVCTLPLEEVLEALWAAEEIDDSILEAIAESGIDQVDLTVQAIDIGFVELFGIEADWQVLISFKIWADAIYLDILNLNNDTIEQSYQVELF